MSITVQEGEDVTKIWAVQDTELYVEEEEKEEEKDQKLEEAN